jgi:Tol biopolymer transport system component
VYGGRPGTVTGPFDAHPAAAADVAAVHRTPAVHGALAQLGAGARARRRTQIAFHSDPGGNDDTYLLNADGSDAHGLTLGRETIAHPYWSPDGSRLAITCCTFSMDRILVVDADGGGAVEVQGDVPDATSPAWSPDGRRTGHAEIFTIRPDGTGERFLRGTEGTANDWCAAWRPR